MRITLAILLSSLYLLINSGIHLNFHYCKDMLMDISLSHEKQHCGNEAKMDCCKGCDDQHLEFNNEQDQVTQDLNQKLDLISFSILPKVNLNLINVPLCVTDQSVLFSSDSSPPEERLYLINCQFTFYG